jgi:polysaccharide export outer membrane protein
LFAGKTLDGAREEIASALKAKAVEPDVIVSMTKNTSRTASVQGSVNNPNIIPLGLSPIPLTSVIAMAGGASKPPYDTYVTVTRGRKSNTVLLQSVIDNPKDDIYISPRDKIFLTYDPQSFSVLGTTGKVGKIPFEAGSISLVEATAMSGGSKIEVADPQGYFIFRYENEAVYREVVGESRFRELISKGMMANKEGFYPIVYRIDMNDPESYIVTQSFPVRNKDVLYLSRHPSTDFIFFARMISSPVSVARNIEKF